VPSIYQRQTGGDCHPDVPDPSFHPKTTHTVYPFTSAILFALRAFAFKLRLFK